MKTDASYTNVRLSTQGMELILKYLYTLLYMFLFVFILFNLEFYIVLLEISMGSKMVCLFLLSLEFGLASIEYIINGNFDYPVLDANGTMSTADGWYGGNF